MCLDDESIGAFSAKKSVMDCFSEEKLSNKKMNNDRGIFVSCFSNQSMKNIDSNNNMNVDYNNKNINLRE
jgi:hypothetical protein